MEKEIVWTGTAQNQLENIYFYLLDETKAFTIPDKVIDAIVNSLKTLKTDWEIYEIDKMKIPIDINYRAFEKYSYRISYKITSEIIYITRVRHTSRNPKFYR